MNTQLMQNRTFKLIALSSHRRFHVIKRQETSVNSSFSDAQGSLAIATKGKIEMILFSEIIYVRSESNYIRFHLKDNRFIFAAKTLKDVSEILERAGFIRVHKSYMLHPVTIKQFDIANSFLHLRGGEKIPVSRSNRKMVSEKLLTCSC